MPPVQPSSRAVVAIFLLIISLPLAANIAGRDGADPQAENRELAPPPTLEPSVASLTTFPARFGSWFEDHFGFRATLIRWYGDVRYFAFGVSPSSAVVKGRDGWLFYADDSGMDDYANVLPLSPVELDAWRDTLVRTHAWLRERGIAYVFTIAPDKHVIYPEYVAESIRPVHDRSRSDQLLAMLGQTAVPAVDERPTLIDAKRRERIYFKTDTHWNDRGALVAYQQVIEAVRRQVAAVPTAWTRVDFAPIERVTEGMDLARMMGLSRVLRETNLSLRPRRPRQANVIEPPGADAADEVGRLVTEIPGSHLPRAVIFRDSFASRLAPFLSEHFSRAVYLWQNDFDADVVAQEHPDIVIQEIVGRHLYGFLPSPELVPQ
jgi:alginate O-acetyltransferase complex protein AlgJ